MNQTVDKSAVEITRIAKPQSLQTQVTQTGRQLLALLRGLEAKS